MAEKKTKVAEKTESKKTLGDSIRDINKAYADRRAKASQDRLAVLQKKTKAISTTSKTRKQGEGGSYGLAGLQGFIGSRSKKTS